MAQEINKKFISNNYFRQILKSYVFFYSSVQELTDFFNK